MKNLTFMRAVLVATFALCLDCTGGVSNGSDQPALKAARATRDSMYHADVAKWLRDSVVVDSLSRFVPTDSLYALFRQALAPTGAPVSLVQAVFCAEYRLDVEYGEAPADLAVNRTLDTVYADRGIRDAFRYFAAHIPNSGHVVGGYRECGPYSRYAPDVVGNT